MRKCLLFVEEEIILSAMCGNASFFVILLAKRCFCGSSQHIRGCSHVNFGHLLSIVLTFSHGVFWSYSRRLSLHNLAVVCLPEHAISFERQTGGGRSSQ